MIKPLSSISIAAAKAKQFKLVDAVTHHFKGHEILTRGDLGVQAPANKPIYTAKVEATLADFFGAEKCVLVRGAGTGALRLALSSCIGQKRKILVHTSPIYPTTQETLHQMMIDTIAVDFHQPDKLIAALENSAVEAILVQTTRQALYDHYDLAEVVNLIKSHSSIPIIVDDNYAVMKIDRIGVEVGATLSAFSAFKLLGPEGIGVIVGAAKYIDPIIKANYSGGSQVQGHEALDVLNGMIYAPVALALQAEVLETTCQTIKELQHPLIKDAFLVNAQSKVLIVEFTQPIAPAVLTQTEQLGAAPYPVGAESKYEVAPMFYRVSGTFIASYPEAKTTMIRINPMRSGPETIIRILTTALEKVM